VAKPVKHDWAYAAGLIDGEGSIILKPQKLRWRRPVVSMSSTTRELCEYLTRFGGAVCPDNSGRRRGHSDAWKWQIQGEDALAFMRGILPFVREPNKLNRIKLICFEWRDLYYDRSANARHKQAAFERRFFG